MNAMWVYWISFKLSKDQSHVLNLLEIPGFGARRSETLLELCGLRLAFAQAFIVYVSGTDAISHSRYDLRQWKGSSDSFLSRTYH